MFGACVAWSAALRGYSVAVIDKGDFSQATSANHYKFLHGGIRYLQHADIPRLRESSRERSSLIRVAPHLAYPMPIVLPTYGRGKKGKLIMRAGMLAYDVLTPDRNRRIPDKSRRTPMGRILGRSEVLRMFPGVRKDGLTGAAVFHDGQMYNPPRLVLSFLKSAAAKGAIAVNYVEAERLLRQEGRVVGCAAHDCLSGERFEIRSRITVNAAGPWAGRLLHADGELRLDPEPGFSRDLAFVIDRSFSASHALGCQARSHDSDALLDRGARHLFLTPWRGKTLVGVWHRYSRANPDRLTVSKEELGSFLDEINGAYDGLDLGYDDIELINTGLILFGSEGDQASSSDHSFAKRSVLHDHRVDGIDGLITLVGARATVARGLGDRTLDLVDLKLRGSTSNASSEFETIHGGDFDEFSRLVAEVSDRLPDLPASTATAVAHNYGAAYRELLDLAPDGAPLAPIADSNVLRIEVTHAIREEMAVSLADVVFRRTELGTGGNPGAEAISIAADIAAGELGWDSATRDSEMDRVRAAFGNGGPWRLVERNDEIPAGE